MITIVLLATLALPNTRQSKYYRESEGEKNEKNCDLEYKEGPYFQIEDSPVAEETLGSLKIAVN